MYDKRDAEADVLIEVGHPSRPDRHDLMLEHIARIKARAVKEALAKVRTHNGTPVTPKNLRWAATHEALCRSYIHDVLMGLAEALDANHTPDAPHVDR